MADLTELTAAASYGYSRPNRYSVSVFPPSILLNQANPQGRQDNKDFRMMMLNCNAAVFPSESYASSEHRVKGPLRKMPYDVIHNDVTLSFYNDSLFSERSFFESWSKSIYQKDNGSFEYYDNYTSEIKINQLDRRNRIIRTTTMVEAWPLNISEMGLGYENENQVQVFTITFAYRDFSSESFTFPKDTF